MAIDENETTIRGIIKKNKFSFFMNILIVFVVTFAVLYFFGLVPEEFKMMVGRETVKETTTERGELPLTIKIPNAEVDVSVYNPSSTSTEVLDEWLLKGTVRYPVLDFLDKVVATCLFLVIVQVIKL